MKYSEKIQFQGEFDVSSILKGIKDIQNELRGTSSPKGKGMLEAASKEIDKLELSLKRIHENLEQGFESDESVKRFSKDMEDVQRLVQGVYKDLKNIADVSLTDNVANLQKQMKDINNSIDKTWKNLYSEIKNSKLSESLKAQLSGLDKNQLLDKSTYNSISKVLKEEIKTQEETLKIEKEKTQEVAKRAAAERVNLSLINNKRINADDITFKPNGFWSPKAGEIREVGPNGGITLTKKTNFDAIVNTKYAEILREYALRGREATEAFKALQQVMKDWGVKDIGNYEEFVNQDFTKIQAKIEKPSISAADSKRITGMENEIKANQNMIPVLERLGNTAAASSSELNRYYAAISDVQTKTNEENKTLQRLKDTFGQTDAVIEEQVEGLKQTKEQVENLGNAQHGLDIGFQKILDRLKYFFSIGTVFSYIRKEIIQTYEDVKNLDKSFAEIAMVTRYSVDDMWKSYSQYAEMANRLGQATNDVIKASALYYQQGKAPSDHSYKKPSYYTWV